MSLYVFYFLITCVYIFVAFFICVYYFLHFFRGEASLILNALCQGLHAHLAIRLSDKLHVQETRLLSIFMGPHELNDMRKLGQLCLSNIQKQNTTKNLNKWEKQKHMKKHSQIYPSVH